MTCTKKANHTPEPWHYEMEYRITTIFAPDQTGANPSGPYIAEIDGQDVGRFIPDEQHEANARRICAAVNACQGISTEALERGAVAELWHILGTLLTAAGDLDAALDGATGEFDAERRRLTSALRAAQAVLDGTAPGLDELLACRNQIASAWSVEDVQEIRPDLTDEQAWQVLQRVERKHDASIGINWDTLEWYAGEMFGAAPETKTEEE